MENVVLNSKDEEKVIIDTSNFINTIKGLKKKKPQEPESKQVNGGLESLNSSLYNADNVESHSSANSSSNVVETEHTQQLAKIITELSTIKTKINDLEEEREEKLEEFDSRRSDLERDLGCLRQNLTKITECAEEHTQLKDNLKTITKKYTQLESMVTTELKKHESTLENHVENLLKDNLKTITEKYTQLESMVTTEPKKHESTLENRVKDLQKQFEGKNKELNSKYEKFLGASNNSKRQGSYASISFVLSGASAVGASLTMFHLAMCLSLAVAALIFLAAGCYCLYKANTTLSNVEIDQTQTILSLTA
ncbi:hypothetical protein [Wolbachia endosymbiont (group B) of Horisme vitalbata]|uniref:TomO hydrophobic C-terminal domain-containing protein n=1 Tax=Wolbachia endosymbiont (group B) of Horisme vitalbata TaxID=3066178 RepID=UPI00333E1B5C